MTTPRTLLEQHPSNSRVRIIETAAVELRRLSGQEQRRLIAICHLVQKRPEAARRRALESRLYKGREYRVMPISSRRYVFISLDYGAEAHDGRGIGEPGSPLPIVTVHEIVRRPRLQWRMFFARRW